MILFEHFENYRWGDRHTCSDGCWSRTPSSGVGPASGGPGRLSWCPGSGSMETGGLWIMCMVGSGREGAMGPCFRFKNTAGSYKNSRRHFKGTNPKKKDGKERCEGEGWGWVKMMIMRQKILFFLQIQIVGRKTIGDLNPLPKHASLALGGGSSARSRNAATSVTDTYYVTTAYNPSAPNIDKNLNVQCGCWVWVWDDTCQWH